MTAIGFVSFELVLTLGRLYSKSFMSQWCQMLYIVYSLNIQDFSTKSCAAIFRNKLGKLNNKIVSWLLHILSGFITSLIQLQRSQGIKIVLMWLTYFLTYLLHTYSRVLLEKLTGSQLVKKFPTFYGTRRFITAFTSARQLYLSRASSIQSIPLHPTSWRSILILSSHLHLGLPSGIFPSGFPTKTLYTPLLSPIYATCPTHLILLYFITRTIFGEQYRSLSPSLQGL